MGKLDGRSAIITGAGRGTGQDIVCGTDRAVLNRIGPWN